MLRRSPLLLATCLLLAVPANAADQAVEATPANTFEPASVEIDVGDKVTFSNGGGFHNVRWDDGAVAEEPADPSAAPWSFERSFDQPGVHRYYCEAHGAEGGEGMSGVVRVRDATGSVPEPEEDPPPGLSMTTKRTQSLARVLKGIRVRARCAGGCNVSFAVMDRGKVIGGRSADLGAGEEARELVIKLRRKARRRLAKREKKFKLVVEAHAVNTGGDHTLERTVTVKP